MSSRSERKKRRQERQMEQAIDRQEKFLADRQAQVGGPIHMKVWRDRWHVNTACGLRARYQVTPFVYTQSADAVTCGQCKSTWEYQEEVGSEQLQV